MKFINLIFMVFGLLLLVSCDHSHQKLSKGHEIYSEVSPDGLNTAFIWYPEPPAYVFLGATESQSFEVWIKSSLPSHDQRLIFSAEKTEGVKTKWLGSETLEICYSKAQIYYFFNSFYTVDGNPSDFHSELKLHSVEVILKKMEKLSDC